MLYSFPTYATGDQAFDECLIDLSEIQSLAARLPARNGLVSLRFQMKASDPLFCSVMQLEYQTLLRVLRAAHGYISIDEDGVLRYSSEELSR